MATASAPAHRLGALSAALREGASLWRSRPFAEDPPSWARAHPEVAAWCSGLGSEQVAACERDDRLPPGAPEPLAQWQERLAVLTELPQLSPGPASQPSEFTVSAAGERLVPARKAEQIACFGTLIHARVALGRGQAVLDWCGGKGHLGRTLGARLGLPVTVLDRDDYADEALALAVRAGVTLRFVRGDALSPPPGLIGHAAIAVALHACGELGSRFIAYGLEHDAALMALSPCCLHKVPSLASAGFAPLSRTGQAVDPGFDHAALRLATADEVVARPGLQRARQRENAFRLGFDLLAREAGAPTYTPLGTLPPRLLRGDFAGFVRAVAALRAIALPARWDAASAEREGWRRAHEARAYGIVRGLFKRAIEVWCALDRAASLEEHGRAVTVGCFTARAVTPRNILIVAT